MLVTLSQGGVLLGQFPVYNIGAGGMAVQGELSSLDLQSMVVVLLHFRQMDEIRSVETKALVVHKNNGLTGLMWIEFDHFPVIMDRTRPASTVNFFRPR